MTMLNEKKWQINLQNYYTPLEVLLEIIKKNHAELISINICDITSKYLEFINDLISDLSLHEKLDEIGEYLNIAQHLVTLKTRYLIQQHLEFKNVSEKFKWTEELLSDLILSVQKYKYAMINLSQKQNERILMLNKPKSEFEKFIPEDFNYEKLPDRIDTNVLLKYLAQYEDEINENKSENKLDDYEIIDISVKDMKSKILKTIQFHDEIGFLELFYELYKHEEPMKYYLVSFFVIVLFLYGEHKINLLQKQDNLFLKLISEE